MATALAGICAGLGLIYVVASMLSFIDGEGFNPSWLWRG
jgi:hypothetical protein